MTKQEAWEEYYKDNKPILAFSELTNKGIYLDGYDARDKEVTELKRVLMLARETLTIGIYADAIKLTVEEIDKALGIET